MRIDYPSESLPPPPAVALELPDDWHPVFVAGTLIAARKDISPQSYAPNVIVTWMRQEPGFDLRGAMAALDEQLATLPGARLLEETEAEISGFPARGRGVVFVDPAIGTLAQFHVYLIVDRGACSDTVHLTATIGGDQIESESPGLRDVLTSVEVRTSDTPAA